MRIQRSNMENVIARRPSDGPRENLLSQGIQSDLDEDGEGSDSSHGTKVTASCS
jgi:hypothetical protein